MLETLRQKIETLSPEAHHLKQGQKPIQYRTQAFLNLLQKNQLTPSNFEPDQAKWEYLQEKYNL